MLGIVVRAVFCGAMRSLLLIVKPFLLLAERLLSCIVGGFLLALMCSGGIAIVV